MKRIKIASGIFGALCLFVLGVFTESYIRSLARKTIPVVVTEDLSGTFEAYVEPDFLWCGEAWWITVRSKSPVQLDIDGKWKAIIPPGTNTVYSNHDINNTTEFGTNRWWKTPWTVTVRKMPLKRIEGGVRP